MISRANYEQYFLDFHEAALSASDVEEMYVFLEQHPDLREEFESFVEVKLEPELNISFKNKSTLHRSEINEKNYLTKLIAYTEGDLDPSARISTEEFIKNNPGISKELEILKRTRIQADHSIVYEGKSSLKRGAKVIPFSKTFYRYTAIAASLLILLISYFVFLRPKQAPEFVNNTSQPNSIMTTPVDVQSPAYIQLSHDDSGNKEKQSPVIPNSSGGTMAQRNLERKIRNTEKEISPVKKNDALPSYIAPATDKQVPLFTEQKIKSEPLDLPTVKNEETFAEQKIIPKGNLSSVFSQEELAEFAAMENNETPKENGIAWELVETGVEKLAKATGAKIDFDRHADHAQNATTYALAIGKFSVSHTRMK